MNFGFANDFNRSTSIFSAACVSAANSPQPSTRHPPPPSARSTAIRCTIDPQQSKQLVLQWIEFSILSFFQRVSKCLSVLPFIRDSLRRQSPGDINSTCWQLFSSSRTSIFSSNRFALPQHSLTLCGIRWPAFLVLLARFLQQSSQWFTRCLTKSASIRRMRPLKQNRWRDQWIQLETCEISWRPVNSAEDLWNQLETGEISWRLVNSTEDQWNQLETNKSY